MTKEEYYTIGSLSESKLTSLALLFFFILLDIVTVSCLLWGSKQSPYSFARMLVNNDRRRHYKEAVNKKDDDEQEEEVEEEEQELCYQTPPRWELHQRDQVFKVAKSILRLSVLSDKGKGPITSSKKNDVERITSPALEVVGRAYDIYN